MGKLEHGKICFLEVRAGGLIYIVSVGLYDYKQSEFALGPSVWLLVFRSAHEQKVGT